VTAHREEDAAVGSQPPRPWTRDRVERSVLRVLQWVAILFFLVVTVFPFYYMVLLSFRPLGDILSDPGSLAVGELTFGAYYEVLTPYSGQGFARFLGNSTLVAAASMLIALAVSIPGAYAIARVPFFGRRQINALFLAAYLIPPIVLTVPMFMLFTRIGLRGSLAGLTFVYISQTVTVAVYMLRNYFEAIPASIEEAGLLDGLTRLGVLRRISFPLAAPSVVATGMFVFVIAWNEYLFARLYLADRPDRWTVSVGLDRLDGADASTTVLMAGSVVITMPIVLLFLLFERRLTSGFS
jgi:multiple sugar transport system permease protein